MNRTGNLIRSGPVTLLFMTLLLIRSQALNVLHLHVQTHTITYTYVYVNTHQHVHTHTPSQTYLRFIPILYSMSVPNWNSESKARVTEQKKTKITSNAVILVTLKNLVFSQIFPHHRQMAESDRQLPVFNQRKEIEKSAP